MPTVLEILDLIASSTKRKFKEQVLTDYKDNALLKKCFIAAYHPDVVYWISKHPVITYNAHTLSLDTAIDEIYANLCTRKITGNNAVNFYQKILSSLSQDDSVVLKRIIDRDLRCGVGIPTINKIWKKLIPVYDLLLADSDPKHLQFPDVVVQTKYDGIRCTITHMQDGEIILRTRNGNRITSLEVMYKDIACTIPIGETWDGELVCFDENNKPLSRKISNGIANKAIRGTISPEEANLVHFMCWDIEDRSQTIPYRERLKRVELLSVSSWKYGFNKKIKPVESFYVKTLEDVEALFKRALDNGEEGVIAKNLNSVWEPKRSHHLCKFKAEKTADLIVVDWESGTGRNQGILGALVCESSDGKIRVNVGSGFSDDDRKNITCDNSIGKIVEVLYNARIDKKDGGVDSLYLPRFLKFRDDKSIANSSEEIK